MQWKTFLDTREQPKAQLHLFHWALRIVLVAMVFANNIDMMKEHGAEAESGSLQAKIKLLCIGLAGVLGAWGWWKDGRVRALCWSVPGILLVFLGLNYVASGAVASSVSKSVAMASAVAYWASVLFVVTCVGRLGGRQVIGLVTIGLLAYVVGSLLLGVVSPEKAKFIEIMDLHTKIERFGGLGQPNTLGRFAMCSVVLMFGMAIDGHLKWRWFLAVGFCATWVGMESMSRTPILAAAVAMIFLGTLWMRRERWPFLMLVGSSSIVVLLIALQFSPWLQSLGDRVIQKFTKTGDVEEVTTLTGRTQIWERAWELTWEKPALGHGGGSTPILLEKLSGHAHNVILDVMVNLGVGAGAIVVLLFLWLIYHAIQLPEATFRGATIFLCLVGMAERLLFGPIPEALTYLWIAMLFWSLQLERSRGAQKRIAPVVPIGEEAGTRSEAKRAFVSGSARLG